MPDDREAIALVRRLVEPACHFFTRDGVVRCSFCLAELDEGLGRHSAACPYVAARAFLRGLDRAGSPATAPE